MLYLAYISSIFRKSSLDELSKLAKFKIIDELLNAVIIETKSKDLTGKVGASIFVYCAFPITHQKKISKKDYLGTILSAITAMKIPKSKGLKLEIVDINEKHGYSSKDIEVRTGLKLEKLKYNIDIKTPQILAYAILLNGKCYSGHVDYATLRKKFVNPLRYYHIKKQVSRSELKLWEAFDELGITGSGTAIDLGAAPGGWSGFMARKGMKVIAIDKGELDYNALAREKIKVAKTNAKKLIYADKIFKTSDIIHIQGGFKEAKKMLRTQKVDMLTDDMNIYCDQTAIAIDSYLKFLKKGAMLVITVKCISKYAPRYIKDAKKLLGKNLKIIGIKVLPSNRQEMTVFARYE